MRKILATMAASLMLVAGLRYCQLIWQGEIEPVFATWFIFCVAVALSLWTYWSYKKASLVSNVNNAIDLVVVWMILFFLIFSSKYSHLGFNSFEIACLLACLIVLIGWKLSRKYEHANLSLQVIMTIAYFPTIHHLWQASHNTESFEVWILTGTSAASGTLTAIVSKDRMAIVYASRAFISVAIILALMLRLELKG